MNTVKRLWPADISLSDVQSGTDNLISHLGIELLELDETSLTGRMPVDSRTKQPWGFLHGGASVALAESLGSYASSLIIAGQPLRAVGLEVNANHLRAVQSGFVHGVCRPIHIGRRTHVWDIQITDDAGKMICVSRLTVAIIEHTD